MDGDDGDGNSSQPQRKTLRILSFKAQDKIKKGIANSSEQNLQVDETASRVQQEHSDSDDIT